MKPLMLMVVHLTALRAIRGPSVIRNLREKGREGTTYAATSPMALMVPMQRFEWARGTSPEAEAKPVTARDEMASALIISSVRRGGEGGSERVW